METNTTSIWETILTVNQFLVGLSRRGLFDFLCWFVIIPRNAHKCRSNRKVERTTYDWLFAGKCGPEINVKKWKYKSCISYFYLSKFEDVLDVAGYFLHQHCIRSVKLCNQAEADVRFVHLHQNFWHVRGIIFLILILGGLRLVLGVP